MAAVVSGLAMVALLPAIALAHPLGNFTINHYAGIRAEPDRVLLDIVVDQAEIPTFQARLGFDTDGDGEVSDDEADGGRVTECESLTPSLELLIGGVRQDLVLTDAGLTFPAGVGGLSTMRVVCEYRVDLATPMSTATSLSFADASFAGRLGWREIVLEGSGVTLSGVKGELRATTLSQRLTAYPTKQLAQAPDDAAIVVSMDPGGETLPSFTAPDAIPVPGAMVTSPPSASPSRALTATSASPASASPSPVVGGAGGVGITSGGAPGGVSGAELPSIFRETSLTPLLLLVSVLTAAALGAGHALTPGHGKTLMAAYLVGSRGTVVHAVGLGLSVTVSHTIGILVLAALVVGAQDVLAPDAVVRGAPVVAAISIVAIGGWMLVAELRRRRLVAAMGRPHEAVADGEHSHDGGSHSHAPVDGSTITWRSLFVLGLAGGLIPSTSALLILLGAIAAGRAGFGFVLVVAFGLGMALIMGGIGAALVLARGRVDRMAPSSAFGRVSGFIPLAAAVLVFSLGLYLTAQAIGGAPVL